MREAQTLHFVLHLQCGGIDNANRLPRNRHPPLSISVVFECIAVQNISENPLACHPVLAATKAKIFNSNKNEKKEKKTSLLIK